MFSSDTPRDITRVSLPCFRAKWESSLRGNIGKKTAYNYNSPRMNVAYFPLKSQYLPKINMAPLKEKETMVLSFKEGCWGLKTNKHMFH